MEGGQHLVDVSGSEVTMDTLLGEHRKAIVIGQVFIMSSLVALFCSSVVSS